MTCTAAISMKACGPIPTGCRPVTRSRMPSRAPWCWAFGLDTIIRSTDRPRDPNTARFLETNASLREKPSLTAEAGHAGTVEPEDVTALIHGCLNMMRYLKMLPGNVPPVQNPVWTERITSVTSETAGVFYPMVKRGWYVQQGMKIGYVTDLFGKTVWEARAPSSGRGPVCMRRALDEER